MGENWRHVFYYTFGLLPAVFFSLRFFIQWINSEKKKRSYVDKTFWHLSFCGNTLQAIHYFVQMQFLLFLLQIVNGFISWRNLSLIKAGRKTKFSITIFLVTIFLAVSVFLLQSFFLSMPVRFLEIPAGLLSTRFGSISILWHIFGAAGCLLFASRFWLQWLEVEKTGVSKLSKKFWAISLIGSLSALLYFFHIKDWISCANYFFGLIPYIRNLVLLKAKDISNGTGG